MSSFAVELPRDDSGIHLWHLDLRSPSVYRALMVSEEAALSTVESYVLGPHEPFQNRDDLVAALEASGADYMIERINVDVRHMVKVDFTDALAQFSAPAEGLPAPTTPDHLSELLGIDVNAVSTRIAHFHVKQVRDAAHGLRALRVARGMSRDDVSALCGISSSRIASIESGNVPAYVNELTLIAASLDATITMKLTPRM